MKLCKFFFLGFVIIFIAMLAICMTAEAVRYVNATDTDIPRASDLPFVSQIPPLPDTGCRPDDLHVDPIHDHAVGEVFFINGTANLLSNETVLVRITAGNISAEKKDMENIFEIATTATILDRTDPLCPWYVLVNTSDESAHFIPNETYHVEASRVYFERAPIPCTMTRILEFNLSGGLHSATTPAGWVSSPVVSAAQTLPPAAIQKQQQTSKASPIEPVLPAAATSLIIVLIRFIKRDM